MARANADRELHASENRRSHGQAGGNGALPEAVVAEPWGRSHHGVHGRDSVPEPLAIPCGRADGVAGSARLRAPWPCDARP